MCAKHNAFAMNQRQADGDLMHAWINVALSIADQQILRFKVPAILS